jgi:hypothetical protein
MVCFAFIKPELETKWTCLYVKLTKILSSEAVRDMLYEENNDGLRPLEFASQQSTLKLCGVIWETPGVYLKQTEPTGNGLYKLYDITDYESYALGKRHAKSPLIFFLLMDIACLNDPDIKGVFQDPFFQLWFKVKASTNVPFVIFWAIIRFLHVAFYTTLDAVTIKIRVTNENSTVNNTICPNFVLDMIGNDMKSSNVQIAAALLCAYSVITLLFDVIETAYYACNKESYAMYKNLSGPKDVVVQDQFYRLAQICTNIVIIMGTSLLLFDQPPVHLNNDLLRIAAPLLIIWSCFYFVQLLPIVGHFVITIQRMVSSMLTFLLIFLLMLIPYLQAFVLYMASHSPEQCVEGFGSFTSTIYSLFNIMLNLTDFMDINFKNPLPLWLLHFSFVFSVAILMLNFLIAVMYDSVAAVSKNRHVIITIQRLTVFCLVEKRCGRIFARYYDWMKAKYYVYDKGRVYLPTLDRHSYLGNTESLST